MTKDIKAEIVKKVNGLDIVRCEAKTCDFDGNLCGQTKVFYDVCDDELLIESFKTLKKAEQFAKSY